MFVCMSMYVYCVSVAHHPLHHLGRNTKDTIDSSLLTTDQSPSPRVPLKIFLKCTSSGASHWLLLYLLV